LCRGEGAVAVVAGTTEITFVW